MIALAQSKSFFMEALWSRFNPALKALKKSVEQGEIGDLRHIQASFSMSRLQDDSNGRILNTAMGGGSLLILVFILFFLLICF